MSVTCMMCRGELLIFHSERGGLYDPLNTRSRRDRESFDFFPSHQSYSVVLGPEMYDLCVNTSSCNAKLYYDSAEPRSSDS